MEAFYTPAQVAEKLQVTERTVYTWIREKELRAVKFGRIWRISESDLKKFIEKRMNV